MASASSPLHNGSSVQHATTNGQNGHANHNGVGTSQHRHTSVLPKTSPDEVFDVMCVGFGPASLGIAIALHDQLSDPQGANQLSTARPRIGFLERQDRFRWHSGMILDGSHMQISFIKDLATLRNPRSEFTFLNYLHDQGRLVPFVNMGTFLPSREEYQNYMCWCAGWFEDLVDYGQEVVSITPEDAPADGAPVQVFVVTARDTSTGAITTRRARNVVVGVGGRANIPAPFSQKQQSPQIVHSSVYGTSVATMLPDRTAAYEVAVIGNGQSGAEIFNDLHARYPRARTQLIIKGSALRPSDDSPFVNECFDPQRVDPFFASSADVRVHALAEDKGTNYGVVRLNMIERLYDLMYLQQLRVGADQRKWQHRIVTHRVVTALATNPHTGRVQLRLSDPRKADNDQVEIHDFDAVFLATGYVRDVHERLLQGSRGLMAGGDVAGNCWQVERNYRVQFARGAVDGHAGIWLQGCNETTHGISDTLLSVVATRSGEMVQSLWGNTN